MTDIPSRLIAALADRYGLERQLGEGGMATVYLAEDLKHDRKVAVKVLRPELAAVLGAERFVQEIKTTANLQHPHILPLFDSGEADSFLFYVMPFIDGETLRDKLNNETQLGVDEAVTIAADVSDALHYAHQQGVIHRDIKPENILLHNGRPMVADFGIALAVSAAAGGRMTETGLSLGTPHYMSPEQATAEKDLTARSDVYSVAAVLYEMLTGNPPHVGATAQQIIMKIVTEDAQPVTRVRKSVPPNVAAAVAKALEKLPADRFESAAEFREALVNPAFVLPTAATRAVGGTGAGGVSRAAFYAVTALAALFFGVSVWTLTRPEAAKPVLRYSLALPESEALSTEGGGRLAISPDGSSLVYVGQDGSLMLRNRAQLGGTTLPGTEGAESPGFSPDGGRVVYWSREGGQGAYRVVSLSGGPPITVADDDVGRFGTAWGPDGFIYGAGAVQGSGLVRVLATGGAAQPVTTPDTATIHLWPDALPGGRGIVFTVGRSGLRGRAREEWDIAVMDLETGTHQILFRGVRARYAASGHLLYVTADGTLMGVPFDEQRLTLTGEPRALVEGVGVSFAGYMTLAVSRTGTLVYGTGEAVDEDRAAVWVTRGGEAEVIDPGWTDRGRLEWPALSPDGSKLAINVGANDEDQVWVKELDRGPLSKLSFAASTNYRPEWTPDGRSVAFVSSRTTRRSLWMTRADGSGPAEMLLEDERDMDDVRFSGDGEWIVYRLNGGPTGRDLFARRVGSDSAIALVATEAQEMAPALSPDGRWLAYSSDRSGQNEVYVRPFPNTADQRWQVSIDGGSEPAWAHSGREIFFKSQGQLVSVDVLPGTTFITGERRNLFPLSGMSSATVRRTYDVAPDDQRFVMIRLRQLAGAGFREELIVVENLFEELVND